MPSRSKLDPTLRETLEARTKDDDGAVRSGSGSDPSSASPVLEVLIAMIAPPAAEELAELSRRGLTVRSTIGEILTGTVSLDAVDDVADYGAVVTIEAGRPLGLDHPTGADDPVPPLDIDDLTE